MSEAMTRRSTSVVRSYSQMFQVGCSLSIAPGISGMRIANTTFVPSYEPSMSRTSHRPPVTRSVMLTSGTSGAARSRSHTSAPAVKVSSSRTSMSSSSVRSAGRGLRTYATGTSSTTGSGDWPLPMFTSPSCPVAQPASATAASDRIRDVVFVTGISIHSGRYRRYFTTECGHTTASRTTETIWYPLNTSICTQIDRSRFEPTLTWVAGECRGSETLPTLRPADIFARSSESCERVEHGNAFVARS